MNRGEVASSDTKNYNNDHKIIRGQKQRDTILPWTYFSLLGKKSVLTIHLFVKLIPGLWVL
jgi:hypothetical protein